MIIKVISVESTMSSLVVEKWVGVILLIIFKKSYLESWKSVLMMSQQGFTASSCKMKIQKIANKLEVGGYHPNKEKSAPNFGI